MEKNVNSPVMDFKGALYTAGTFAILFLHIHIYIHKIKVSN